MGQVVHLDARLRRRQAARSGRAHDSGPSAQGQPGVVHLEAHPSSVWLSVSGFDLSFSPAQARELARVIASLADDAEDP